MIGQFFDIIIVASTDRVITMTHQNLNLGNCWKLFWATLTVMLLFGCSWFYFGFIKRDLFRVGKFCFHFSRKLGSIVEYVNAIASVRKACKMKFLAIAPLRIYFCGTGAAGRGPGSFNAAASWVIASEYLSLRLHVGNHSWPTPFTTIYFCCCCYFFAAYDGLQSLGLVPTQIPCHLSFPTGS